MRIVGDGNWDQWRLKVTSDGGPSFVSTDRMDADVPEYLRDKARVKK
jgi:hypothetical protein